MQIPSSGSTLPVWQEYIRRTLKNRGFDDERIEQKFMLLAEEVGELAKAIRKESGIKMSEGSAQQNLREEIGDVFILLTDICNKLDVDLEEAVILKEQANSQRNWV